MYKKYQNYLTFGRGISIIMVISVHYLQSFPTQLASFTNYILAILPFGVQLFFIISSISLIINFENKKEKKFFFYLRRLFRIAPMYYFGIFLYNFNNKDLHISDIVSNIFFLHGFWPSGNNNVVPGGWSIATEMTFYAIFPFLLNFLKKNKDYTIILFFLLFLVIFGMLKILTFLNHYELILNPILGNTLAQFIVFYITMFFFLKNKKYFKSNQINIFICVISFTLSIISINNLFHYQVLNSHIAKLFFVTVFFYIFINFIKNFKLISKKNLIFKIGICSYSMYILHFFVLNLCSKISNYYNLNLIFFNYKYLSFFLLIINIIITYLIAYIFTNTIEKFGIEKGRKIINSIKMKN
jgi:peptidoglycan/LPS O-acetylase OafA/YrhL